MFLILARLCRVAVIEKELRSLDLSNYIELKKDQIVKSLIFLWPDSDHACHRRIHDFLCKFVHRIFFIFCNNDSVQRLIFLFRFVFCSEISKFSFSSPKLRIYLHFLYFYFCFFLKVKPIQAFVGDSCRRKLNVGFCVWEIANHSL